jgi:hypothetical protein
MMRRRVARTEARRRTRPAFNSHVLGGRNMVGFGIGKFGNMRAQAA